MDIEIDDNTRVYTNNFQMYVDLFLEYYKLETIDNQSHWELLLRYLYKNLYKPKVNMPDNRKCIIPYDDIESINNIYDSFIETCLYFKRRPTVEHFCLLIGMSRQTFKNICDRDDELSVQWLDIKEKIETGKHNALDYKLFDSNNVTGQAILANHEYCYNLPGVSKERSQDNKLLSASQLPKLSLADGHNTMIESKD